MPSPSYPQINKKAYSFCSIELSIDAIGDTTIGIQSVDYKMSLKPGAVTGASARKNGRTLGKYEPSASMTMYKLDADAFIAELGDGFGEVEFNIIMNFAEDGMPISTVEIIGCRIAEMSEDNKEGEEATMTKFDLDVMDILINNKSMIKQSRR